MHQTYTRQVQAHSLNMQALFYVHVHTFERVHAQASVCMCV